MGAGDWGTTIGGNQRAFPSTCWSRLFQIGDPKGTEREKALEELAGLYWKPIYCFIRKKTAKPSEDSKDLTQEFFAWMFESDFLTRADPQRGSFRAFVKASLENFLSSEARKSHRLKRGGDRRIFTLDASQEDMPQVEDDGKTPEQTLDESWKDELLSRAVDRLEEVLGGEDKALYYRIFRDYYLSGNDEVDYKKVASTYGIGTRDVSNYLIHAKKRFRSVLADLVSETVSDSEDLRQELRTLFGNEME